jgi:DNA-binding response OmpR family regulator
VCIDDDPHINKALRLRLKSMKIDVLHASNGRDGLRLIRKRIPDLVISDWWMDQGDGEFVLKQMQSSPDTAHIPVIMVSGVGRPDFMNRMFAQGARSCYTKPIQFEALREDVCTLLDIEDPSGRATNRQRSCATRKQSRRSSARRSMIRLDSSKEINALHWSK